MSLPHHPIKVIFVEAFLRKPHEHIKHIDVFLYRTESISVRNRKYRRRGGSPEANSLVLDLGISVTSYDGYSPPLPLPLFRTQIYKIYRGTKRKKMKTKHLTALSHDRWIHGSPTPSSFYRTQIFFWIEKTKCKIKKTQNNKSTEYDKYKQQIQTNHFKYSI